MLDENIRQKLAEASGKARIVFWEDASGEFVGDVAGLEIPGATVIDVRGCELATKRRVLRIEREGRFVLYRAGGAPRIEEDFLLDVKMLARPFSATQSASWAEECGLPLEAADMVLTHAAFFGAKERRQALRALVERADWMAGGYTDKGLVFSLLAACCGSRSVHRVDTVRDMASKALEEYARESDALTRLLDRCGLADAFWDVMGSDLGYRSETPGLEDFAFEAMLTACSDLTGKKPPLSADAALVVSNLANEARKKDVFEALVNATCDYVTSLCNLDSVPLETLAAHRYLPVVDDRLLWRLAADVAEGVDCADRIAELRSRRAASAFSHNWVAGYDTLIGAAGVLAGVPKFERELGSADTVHACFGAYVDRWSAVDTAYRAFWVAYPAAALLMRDVFEGLSGKVEVAYARYSGRLAAAWQGLVVSRGAWPYDVEGVSQRTFFASKVRTALIMGRVTVIVSDALRYEAGADWAQRVRDRRGTGVECSALLASLPSYTQLGMASLLPGAELSISPITLAATVDGQDATGGRHREGILCRSVPDAVVISYEDLVGQDGEERLEGASLAYVYHNVIDATGDKRDSEEGAFGAVETAFVQLDRACARLFELGFRTVLVTADHGFLYQQDPQSFEFADVPFLSAVLDVQRSKRSRRFVAAPDLPSSDTLVELGAGQLGLAGDFEVGLPKGTRRLRLQGSGARFVHGGMTLQETVVPCVQIERTRARGAGHTVEVDLLTGGSKVISGSLVRFALYQTEPVGEGVLPASLRVGLYDADGTLCSESKPVEAASSSANAEDRRVAVELTVAKEVKNGVRLTLRVERRYGATSKYKTIAEATYTVRRNFGMDF